MLEQWFLQHYESIFTPWCCLCAAIRAGAEAKPHSGTVELEQSIPIFCTPLKAAAAAHAWRIYFITGSRSATPRWPCNHLLCLHIHCHEAVIFPVHREGPLACVALPGSAQRGLEDNRRSVVNKNKPVQFTHHAPVCPRIYAWKWSEIVHLLHRNHRASGQGT